MGWVEFTSWWVRFDGVKNWLDFGVVDVVGLIEVQIIQTVSLLKECSVSRCILHG